VKATFGTSYRIALMLAGAMLSLCATTAHSQTQGRLGGPLAVFYGYRGAGYLTPYPAYIDPAMALSGAHVAGSFEGLTLSAPQYVPYPDSTADTYGRGDYAASSRRAAGAVQQTATLPQTSSTIKAQRTSSNQLLLQWNGDTSTVRRVSFVVLDEKKQVIEQKVVLQRPVQARFTLTDAARYYGVQVKYLNGATNTVYSPLVVGANRPAKGTSREAVDGK